MIVLKRRPAGKMKLKWHWFYCKNPYTEQHTNFIGKCQLTDKDLRKFCREFFCFVEPNGVVKIQSRIRRDK